MHSSVGNPINSHFPVLPLICHSHAAPADDWDSISEADLTHLVWSETTTVVASRFGVSDNAITKKCRKLGIPKPPRGFWAKVEAGKIPHPNGKPPDEDSEG